MSELLPPDALKGVCLGVSASGSADLTRLGLLDRHFTLALAELARLVVTAGGTLAYGGHLDPEGYTAFLVQELRRYGRADRPMLLCLAWSEHRRLPLSELRRRHEEVSPVAEVVYLAPDGDPTTPDEGRDEAPVTVDAETTRRALTGMRRYMSDRIDGRVLIGGPRRGFLGEIPGLMEEALLALAKRRPLYLAGGFGGVTLDVARALGVDDGAWLPPSGDEEPEDPRFTDGFERLRAFAARPGWAGPANGLTDDENRALAATHRPSEIASLVSLGLGRLRGARPAGS